jgi:hypothetical protein
LIKKNLGLVKGQIKMNKRPSKWPWLNHIGYIEWIEFNQIDHLDLILIQIDHNDLTFSQVSHIHSIT